MKLDINFDLLKKAVEKMGADSIEFNTITKSHLQITKNNLQFKPI